MEFVNPPSYEVGSVPQPKAFDKRVCAFQYTYSHMCEFNPNACMLTYDFEKFRYTEMLLLAKIVVGLGQTPQWLTRENISGYSAKNIPGGLMGSGRWQNTDFSIESYPIITDRAVNDRSGGMAVRVKADCPIWIKACGGNLVPVMCYYDQSIEAQVQVCENTDCAPERDMLSLTGKEHPVHVYINGAFPDIQSEDDSRYGQFRSDGKELLILIGFSDDKQKALEIASGDPLAEIEKVISYYDKIQAEWFIKTPDANLDEAFLHARLNVEYGWLRPYGWAEALHHWISMWHMEHTAAEEWAGNADRSREIFISQLERLLDGDKVPELSASGLARKEWGGDNNYFFRGVDHYLKMTGDIKFAQFAEPYMEKILAQTFREYDPTGSGIMGFGTQLGNQEDFEGTPGQGSGSGLEGAYMLRVMAEVKRLLGKEDEAENYQARSLWARQAVYKKLWLKDLGHYAWYEDALGQMRLDPAYHSICYPIIYDMLKDSDMVSSIDHLLNRMTGPDGEMYISNHFGGHSYHNVATWGMQCGANMQPFAALACSRLGMGDQAVRPLKFIADIVCDKHNGCFPEMSNEPFKSYFTPAACMYSVGIIEGIFGLERDIPFNSTKISPCFPSDWRHAEICVHGAGLKYERTGQRHVFTGYFNDNTQKTFCWRLPPYSKISAQLNGKEAKVNTVKRCGWFEAEISLGEQKEFSLELTFEPIDYSVELPGCAAEGENIKLRVSGADIAAVKDPCGVISETVPCTDSFGLRLQTGLLKPYEQFGWFGKINFARRTFFAVLKYQDISFTVPVHITVLPQYAAHAQLDGAKVKVTLHSYTGENRGRDAILLFAGSAVYSAVSLDAQEISQIVFSLTPDQMAAVLPGYNKARLIIGDYSQEISFDYSQAGRKRAEPFELEADMLKSALYWNKIGKCATPPDSTIFCNTPDDFFQDVFDNTDSVEGLPGVPFNINKKGFIPVSSAYERLVTISLKGLRAKKLYILMAAFISNQHVFTEPFRMELEAVKTEEYFRPVFIKKLCFPGELDIGLSGKGQYGFPTYISEQKRGGLPPMPGLNDADYPMARPHEYPQHYLWNMGHAVQVCETVFSIIEIEMDKSRELEELRVIVNDSYAGAGIYAISYIDD